MLSKASDPLLRWTRLLLVIALIIFGVSGVAALVALLPLWLFEARVLVWLSAHSDGPLVARDALFSIGFTLIGIAVINGLSAQFLRKLIAIIDSVGQGSPFIPQNVDHLRVMGWLALATQAMGLVGLPLGAWLRHALANKHIFVPFSLAGLVTALLLFILARVFEHGTRLSEDVEGTV